MDEDQQQIQSNKELLLSQPKQNQNQDSLVRHFTNNGYKVIQIIKPNEDKQLNTCFSIKAYCKQNKKNVVIKIIQGDNLNQVKDNIELIQQKNPSFIQKYLTLPKINEEEQFLYYVSEYHKNQNLHLYSSNNKLNIDLIERIVCKIFLGLQHLHENNLSHGRIKPENILIDENQSIKLSDYCLLQDDNYFISNGDDDDKNISQNIEQSNNIKDKQKQDFYRVGLVIIQLCDILINYEKDLDTKIKYNSNRSYKLQQIARQIMNESNPYYFNIPEIVKRLNYFEENFLFYFNQSYEGELLNGKRNGRGITRFKGGQIKFSTWKDNKVQFVYLVYYQDGNITEMQIPNENEDQAIQIGKIIWFKKKTLFEGPIKDYQPYGEGTIFIQDTLFKKGNFINGKAEGYFEIKYKNGDTKKGNVINGVQQRLQKTTCANQSYFGQIKNNKLEGKGVLKFNSGVEYNGEMKNTQFHGKGILYWGNGDYYEGDFVEHKREGYGKLFQLHGQYVYEGYFKDNKKHGKGKQTNHGQVQIGQWENDVYKGESIANQENQEKVLKKCTIF